MCSNSSMVIQHCTHAIRRCRMFNVLRAPTIALGAPARNHTCSTSTCSTSGTTTEGWHHVHASHAHVPMQPKPNAHQWQPTGMITHACHACRVNHSTVFWWFPCALLCGVYVRLEHGVNMQWNAHWHMHVGLTMDDAKSIAASNSACMVLVDDGTAGCMGETTATDACVSSARVSNIYAIASFTQFRLLCIYVSTTSSSTSTSSSSSSSASTETRYIAICRVHAYVHSWRACNCTCHRPHSCRQHGNKVQCSIGDRHWDATARAINI